MKSVLKLVVLQQSLLLALVVLLSACASRETRLSEVQRGMNPEEVRSLLGSPTDKTFRGSQELWTYSSNDGAGAKVVIFESGKVTELLNTKDAKELHQVQAGDISTREKKNYRCTGSNEYGRFVEGGGCNLYGCWPRGGYCNQFGCSTTGSCTARSCPDKIASLRCED